MRALQEGHCLLPALAARLTASEAPMGPSQLLLSLPASGSGAGSLSLISPSAVTRNTLRPTSMPVWQPVSARGCTDTPSHEKQTDHPSTARLLGTVLSALSRGRL